MATTRAMLSAILPNQEELSAMGRRRYQHPSVLRTKGSRPQWYIRVYKDVLTAQNRIERKPERVYLAYCDEKGKREVEKLRDEVCKGINNTPLVIQSQIPFRDLAETYRKTYIPALKDNTQGQYRMVLDRHILTAFGNLKLHQVDAPKVQQWVNEMEDEGLSRASRASYLSVLRSMFAAADEWGYIETKDPTRRVKLGPGGPVREKRAYTPAECALLIHTAEEFDREANDGARWALQIETAVFTGLRWCEMAALRWLDVDMDDGIVQVRSAMSRRRVEADPKTHFGNRELPLGNVRAKLAAVRPAGANPDDMVFGESTYNIAYYNLRLIADQAGLAFHGFGWHTLRRTYCTLADEHFGDRAALQKQMGHGSQEMTERYIVRSLAKQAETLERIENAVFSGQNPDKKARVKGQKVISIMDLRRPG